MTHYTATEIINGNWRNTLIIETDAPTGFPAEIRFDEETSAGTVTTIYPVIEALDAKESKGNYHYWFTYNESHALFDGESAELHDTKANLADAGEAISTLTGGGTVAHIEEAREYRAKIEQAATHLPDDKAFSSAELFPLWSGAGVAYATGDRRRFNGELYKCLQGHTSQASWTPTAAPSLWARIDDPAIEWPAWVQPTGANPYPLGAKVTHKGKRWISRNAANVWEPGAPGVGANIWEEQE